MAILTNAFALFKALAYGDISSLAPYLKAINLGLVIRGQSPTPYYRAVPKASADYQLATVKAVELPEYGRAASVVKAFSRAGGVTGELTIAKNHATPTTGQVGVSPSGQVTTLASDAITLMDVVVVPMRGEVVELTLATSSNVLTIPSAYTACMLLEAESLAGSSTGKKIVLTPSASAPAAGQAVLNLDMNTVTFATGEATSARVKLLVQDIDLSATLEAAAVY